MYRPRSTNEWVFLGTATAQAACTTAFDLYVLLGYFNWINPVAYQVPRSYVVPVNTGLFILGNLFQALLALDALHHKNNLQLISICVVNVTLSVFSVMRYFQTLDTAQQLQLGSAPGPKYFTDRSIDYPGKVRVPLLATASVVGVFTVSSFVSAVLLQREFRWMIYRHISGSREMLRRLLAYQVLIVLIRIEPFFLIAFVITYGLVDVHYQQPEFGLTMALIPALAILVIMTIVFTKSENLIGSLAAIVLRLGEMAYFASRIIVLKGHGLLAKTLLKDEMIFFASVALGLSTLICLCGMLCVTNFNKGLKPLLQQYSWNKTPHEFEPVNEHRYSERIDLD